MFEHLLRALKDLEGKTVIEVPVEPDAEGYLDRECPAEACQFEFKIQDDDWKSIVRSDEVFCPMCRHAAHSRSWFTKAQVEAGRDHARRVIGNRIGSALRADAASLNSRRRPDSFLQISARVTGGPHLPPLPLRAAEPMRLRASCEACGCRYSYVGSAFFCPACGHNSASGTFDQTIESARRASAIRQALRETLSPDDAEVVGRLLREKAVSDIVTSVQRLAERVWESVPGAEVPTRNLFQRLDEANALWRLATGLGWDDILSPSEFRRLKLFYQRRHVLAHREGIVDAEYIRKSADPDLQVGQRVVIDEALVLEFADLASRLGQGLLHFLPDRTDIDRGVLPTSPSTTTIAAIKTEPVRMRNGLSDEAEAVGRVLVESSSQGRQMDPQLSPDHIRSATGLPDEDISEAVHELESHGLVRRYTTLGMDRVGFIAITPLPSLFVALDPVFGIGDPVMDARTVAAELLSTPEGVATIDLAGKLDWPPRRMNPALDVLIERGLVMRSEVIDQEWVTPWVRPQPGLRTFAREGTR